MTLTLTSLIIWLLIAALVGFVGELISRRRAPDGIIGAIILGFLAILLVVGILHFHIAGEPFLAGVPLISAIKILSGYPHALAAEGGKKGACRRIELGVAVA